MSITPILQPAAYTNRSILQEETFISTKNITFVYEGPLITFKDSSKPIQPPTFNDIKKDLNLWVQQGSAREQRGIARDRILAFFSPTAVVHRSLNFGNSYNIDLSDLELRTIPAAMFEFNVLRLKLRSLDLSNNQLETLPKETGSLRAIQKLNLSRNRDLTTLPDSITLLPETCKINLSECPIEALTNFVLARKDPYHTGPAVLHPLWSFRRASER